MQGKRLDRVNHLLQMELSNIVVSRMRDPRLGFVTITHVDVSPDLKSACVYYSVLGDEKKRQESQAALEHAKGFLQKEMVANLKLRYTPKLLFKHDDSVIKGMEVDRVLRDLHDQEESS